MIQTRVQHVTRAPSHTWDMWVGEEGQSASAQQKGLPAPLHMCMHTNTLSSQPDTWMKILKKTPSYYESHISPNLELSHVSKARYIVRVHVCSQTDDKGTFSPLIQLALLLLKPLAVSLCSTQHQPRFQQGS